MSDSMEKKLEFLKREIESLRTELHYEIFQEGSTSVLADQTYAASDQLDKLIVQFLKVKEQIASGPGGVSGDSLGVLPGSPPGDPPDGPPGDPPGNPSTK